MKHKGYPLISLWKISIVVAVNIQEKFRNDGHRFKSKNFLNTVNTSSLVQYMYNVEGLYKVYIYSFNFVILTRFQIAVIIFVKHFSLLLFSIYFLVFISKFVWRIIDPDKNIYPIRNVLAKVQVYPLPPYILETSKRANTRYKTYYFSCTIS